MRLPRTLIAGIGVILLAGTVSAGVTLAVLSLQSRTNPQSVDIRSGVTISEDSAIVQAAARAKPAVVSIVTAQEPSVRAGSGYLVTSDGYIVTNVDVIAGSSSLVVLLGGDPKLHEARLVDYDCETAVAVLKIDQVSGLPTLAFGDPAAVTNGQAVVAIAGPLQGGAITRGIVSALHRSVTVNDPVSPEKSVELSDTILTDTTFDSATSGGPLINIQAQVIGVAMQGSSGTAGYGLNAADIQDDVQQILQTGQLTVPSFEAQTADLDAQTAALRGLPEGGLVVSVVPGGVAAVAGLQPGDVITQLDESKVDAAHSLGLLLRSQFHVNQRITLTYSRNGTSAQVQLTLIAQHPVC
jgi:putative serine protease PepD